MTVHGKEGEPMIVQWEAVKQDIGSRRKTVFRFEEPYTLLGTLLAADVQSDGHFLLEALESVRSGKFQAREITGNVCSLLMGRERVVVLDALAPDGVGKACVVEFGEFERILESWLDSGNISATNGSAPLLICADNRGTLDDGE